MDMGQFYTWIGSGWVETKRQISIFPFPFDYKLTKWNHSNWCDEECEMGCRLTCDISVSQLTVSLLLATLKLLSVVKCVKC